MKIFCKITTLIVLCLLAQACNDYPVDDNGLLITDSEECYISSLILRGPDDRDVLVSYDIDDEAGTITGVAKFGTNLSKLKPQCGTAKVCIVTPNMGVWTDFTQPREYTVISGNREVKKTYTITITLENEQ